MSLAGLRKQLNKANQFMSEKIGGAEGTKLDDEYLEIERKVDTISKLFEDVMAQTHEFLQPNPAHRAKLMTMNTLNKLQGKSKNAAYPQPENQLGECMVKYGRDLGPDSCYGQCLVQAGESFKYLAEIKYTMEEHVKENFLDPLHSVQTHELKEINHHRKKLEGRRLDFDCKKRKQDRSASNSRLPEDDLKVAEEKFQESKVLAEQAMINFLNSEFLAEDQLINQLYPPISDLASDRTQEIKIDQVQALTEFITAQADYHRQATDIMEQLRKFLIDKKDETNTKPRKSHEPKRVSGTLNHDTGGKSPLNSALSTPAKNGPNPHTAKDIPVLGPSCRALFDFEAENDSELPFSEGDIISLILRVDENWFEGELNGRKGYFPVNYVEVINPLP